MCCVAIGGRGAGLSFMVVPVARHERLGTGAIFSKMFPMDIRGLGTGAMKLEFVPHGFEDYKVVLGTDG